MLFSMYGSSVLISKWRDHARFDFLDLPLHAHCHYQTTFASILVLRSSSTGSYELSVTSNNVPLQPLLMKPEAAPGSSAWNYMV